MNRINQKLQEDKKLLSIYFTAGFPQLNDTVTIIERLEISGVDMIEIGLPFSDPLADGPTIQASSTTALNNGMTTKVLFEQLKDILPIFFIAIICGVFIFAIDNYLKIGNHMDIIRLLIGSFLGSFCYVLISYIANLNAYTEIKNIIYNKN